MGLLDKFLSDPMAQLGIGLLASNTGNYGQFGPALRGGINQMYQMQNMQQQQKLNEMMQKKTEMELKKAQERERWMQGLPQAMKPKPVNAPQWWGDVPAAPKYEQQLLSQGVEDQQKVLQDYMLQPGSPYLGDVLKQRISQKQTEYGTKPFVDASGNTWLIGKDGTVKKIGVRAATGPSKTRTIVKGDMEIVQEFDPSTGKWVDIGSGPRWNPNPSTVIENYPAPIPVVTPEGEAKLVQFGKKGSVKETEYKPYKTEKPTDSERATMGYLSRMQAAEKLIREHKKGIPTEETSLSGAIPFVGDYIQRKVMTPEQQMYKQAADDWIRAKLRKESGAVISDQEMEGEYRTYFPQPGDTPEVIAQKAAARKQAEEQMKMMAGPAFKPKPKPKSGTGKGKIRRYNPQTGRIE